MSEETENICRHGVPNGNSLNCKNCYSLERHHIHKYEPNNNPVFQCPFCKHTAVRTNLYKHVKDKHKRIVKVKKGEVIIQGQLKTPPNTPQHSPVIAAEN